MKSNEESAEFNRREFLKNTSRAAFMAMMGGVELRAAEAAPGAAAEDSLTPLPPPAPVNYGVIGAGVWGREIITTLAQFKDPATQAPIAPVVAVCDHYPGWLNRAGELAPKAERFEDYQKLLAKKEVQAVVVATPTPQHREIVLAALQAGKHVYCEAPLENSIEDAKEIARAAQAAFKQVFQAGLQERSHPQRHFLWPFLRAGALGRNVMARAQWHKKGSWARTAPTEDRTKELNWRLRRAESTGLMGECCIHLLDAVTWFLGGPLLGGRPSSVAGVSSTILWNDGRDVPDTVLCVFQFPEGPNAGVRFLCDASLCSSFDAQYEMYYGSDSSILVRESKAWMFKEVDSPLLGWEVYARKDSFGAETGVSLVANASKQKSLTEGAISAPPFPNSPLYYALEAFTWNSSKVSAAVQDYVENFGDADTPDFRAHVASERKATLAQHPAAGWREGLEATVLAVKANEATLSRRLVALEPELFEI